MKALRDYLKLGKGQGGAMTRKLGFKNIWLLTFAIALITCLVNQEFVQIAIMIGVGFILYHVMMRPNPQTISKATFKQPTSQPAHPNKLMPVGQPKREKKQVQR